MSILTQSGRAAIAASLREQPIHLAWGSGDSTWESSYKVEKTFAADGKITLDHHTIKDVKFYTGQTIYQSSIDYTVDSSEGTIEAVKNSAIIADSVITIGYTQGTPPELIISTQLLKEVGRRVVDEVLFCSGDENGELVTPSGRFKPSNVPINNLYLKFTFDFTDAANQVIRELGVMVGTKIKEGLPEGQRYFELPGKEPAPGSSYQITYRCRTHVSPEDISEEGCKVKGAVDNSLVLIDYTWKMPRFDLITIDAKGAIRRIKGIAHPWRPSMPKAPSGQLLLCYIHQTWKKGEGVKIVNNAIHAVPMNELEAMKKGINDLYALVAQERLRSDANSREPTTKKGVFVDPFFDDDMRDQGISQFAAIVNRELVLPIDVEVADIEKGGERYLLPYELDPVLEQLLQTKGEKINPYQAFDPVPAQITLNKNIDHWTEVKTNWKSPVTRVFNVKETTELLSSTSYETEFMREAIQNFEIEGFEPSEKLKEIKFDGIFIQPKA